jgi:hypothetical protein
MKFNITIEVDGIPAPIYVESGHFAIRESIDFFLPSATLVYKDRTASFVSTYPIMQDTTVKIGLDDGTSLKSYDFYAFSSSKQQTMGGVEHFQTSLDLLSVHAKPLLTDGEYHSQKSTASDYVSYIAGQCGLKADVEATKDVRSWVNPNWKYSQMVRFLAQRCVSASGSGGFLYFVRPDGTLVFKSPDKLFDDEDAIDLTVGSYVIEGEDGEEGETIENRQFLIKDNHFANVILGANNLNLSVYDYKSGATIETKADYQSYLKKRGSVKGVATSMAETGRNRFGGTWYADELDFPASINMFLYNKVLRQLEATQVQIMTPLDNVIRLGGVVNLSVPANKALVSGGVNLNYSGRYLIKTISTVGSDDCMKKLVLVRPGISLPDERKPNYF